MVLVKKRDIEIQLKACEKFLISQIKKDVKNALKFEDVSSEIILKLECHFETAQEVLSNEFNKIHKENLKIN